MPRCCLCQSLGASANDHDESHLELLLDHADIHNSQINRYAKANIFKVFSDCFPNIAANHTVREMVDLMDALRNSDGNDGTEGKTKGVTAKRIKKASLRQDTILVKNTEKQSPIRKRENRSCGESPEVTVRVQCRKILEASCGKKQRSFQCGVCDSMVVLRHSQGNGFDSGSAIGHVLAHHMDIKPYRCCYCDHTAKIRSLMSTHIKTAHQVLDYRSLQYIDETNAHKKEISEMVATCFGKKSSKTGKSPKIPIHVRCRKILEASCDKKQRSFNCGLCDELVVLRSPGRKGLDGRGAISHVLSHHMDISPYRCHYCDYTAKQRSMISIHIKTAHQTLDHHSIQYIDETDAHKKEICGMVATCFPKKQSKASKRFSRRLLTIPMHIQCRKILEASCDKDQRRFHCGICRDMVALRSPGRKGLDARSAIAHVLSRHMDIKPYRCRYCDHTTSHRASMACHVKETHETADYRSIHYINETSAHKKEICQMVETCFSKKQRKANKSESQKKIKSAKPYKDTSQVADNGNQSDTCGEEDHRPHEPSMISAHCERTLAPYSTEQHRFECGICGNLIVLRSGPKAVLYWTLATQHAVAHMEIRPYSCRYCNVALKTQSCMRRHLKKAHELEPSSSIHYVSEIGVHEKEICEMITMCFGIGKKGQQASE